MWNESRTPLFGYTALLSSLATMKVLMRVISVCQASASRSYISLMCSSTSSGTPLGLRGKRHVAVHALGGLVDAALDLAHVGHEAVQALAIRGGQRAVKTADLVGDGIQQAQRLRAPRRALRVVRAIAEQLLEQHLRIVLHRQRRGLALPGQRIAVGTGHPSPQLREASSIISSSEGSGVSWPRCFTATWSMVMPSRGWAPDAALAPLRNAAEERLWLPVAPPGP